VIPGPTGGGGGGDRPTGGGGGGGPRRRTYDGPSPSPPTTPPSAPPSPTRSPTRNATRTPAPRPRNDPRCPHVAGVDTRGSPKKSNPPHHCQCFFLLFNAVNSVSRTQPKPHHKIFWTTIFWIPRDPPTPAGGYPRPPPPWVGPGLTHRVLKRSLFRWAIHDPMGRPLRCFKRGVRN